MFYVSELHMGYVPGDGYELISWTDTLGPFKSFKKAKDVFKDKICDDKNLNHWDFSIRGPYHSTNGYPTQWYNFKLEKED